MTLSVDLAATIAAVAGLVTVVGNLVLQIMQLKQLRKSNENGLKLDANTALTQKTAEKVDAVHDEVVAATGQHPVLKVDQ